MRQIARTARVAVALVTLLSATAKDCGASSTCQALGGCPQKAPDAEQTHDHPPAGEPRPQADPVPRATPSRGAELHWINLACSWKGARWMQVVPTVGGPLGAIERRWTDDSDPSAVGGQWSNNYQVAVGTVTAVDCRPMGEAKDKPKWSKGLVSCTITDGATTVDFKVTHTDGIRCYYLVRSHP